MPRGLIRFQKTGEFHFITFSCYRRLPHLGTAGARDLFESALETIRRRYTFVVSGYVVMPEHIHLPGCEPRETVLSRVIQAMEIESDWTAARRGWELPEGFKTRAPDG